MKNTYSERFLRKRKFLVVLPLLVLPFLTLAFWSMGGGNNNGEDDLEKKTGLNLELPNAFLKDDKDLSKMSFYEQAKNDSAKHRQSIQNDLSSNSMETYLNRDQSGSALSYDPTPYNLQGHKDPNEEKVYRKLQHLNKQLSSNPGLADNAKTIIMANKDQSSIIDNDLQKLERMMSAGSKRAGEDPEIRQLNGMMDKILDIQHPERVKEKLKQSSVKEKDKAFIAQRKSVDVISYFGNGEMKSSQDQKLNFKNAFYALSEKESDEEYHQNAIEAVVHETTSVVNGSSIKLRLLNDIYINGTFIPKNTFIYGNAVLAEERLRIEIKSIRSNSSIFPVTLSVYDLDGNEGIYVLGSISLDAARNSKDDLIRKIDLSGIDPSIKTRAADAAIETAKSVITKKTKQIPVTVKSGYQVLLKNKNDN